MFREAASAPSAVSRQIAESGTAIIELSCRLRADPPRFVVTCARGSSNHAATYAKYLIESRLGFATVSAAPSISSQYAVPMRLDSTVFLVISQSGASPDLLSATAAARESGALVVALVNTVDSPLALLSDVVIPLNAGPELSVAATKSFITTLSAIAQLVGHWTEDESLLNGIAELPDDLERAWRLDWSIIASKLTTTNNLFVIGRGVGLGVAQEAALKLKETCGLHAEAYSAAEVRHGPMAIVGAEFPVLLFSQSDQTEQSVADIAHAFCKRGAKVIMAGPGPKSASRLPFISHRESAIEPILLIQSFYRAANELSLARGLNPDSPPSLNKVTETL